jgi:hypothetical protein
MKVNTNPKNSGEVKKSWHCAQFNKNRGNFTFFILFSVACKIDSASGSQFGTLFQNLAVNCLFKNKYWN